MSCSLCERRTSFCTGLISRKLYGFFLMFLTSFTSLIVSLLFPLLITFFVIMDSFLFCFIRYRLYSLDQPICLCVCLCRRVNVHHKDWLTYSGGTDTPGVFYYNFYYDLTQMVNFPTRIPGSDSHSPALLDLFLLTHVFLLKWVSLCWEILIM